jgi:hypothetical protein
MHIVAVSRLAGGLHLFSLDSRLNEELYAALD